MVCGAVFGGSQRYLSARTDIDSAYTVAGCGNLRGNLPADDDSGGERLTRVIEIWVAGLAGVVDAA